LYTTLPEEVVLEGMDQQRNWIETEFEGIKMQVEPLSFGEARVVRIYSTDPRDFLNPRIQPGAVINYKQADQLTNTI